MTRANLIDRVAEYVSPRWAHSRARARIATQLLRAYDAAGSGRRTEGWRTKNTSANAETQRGLAKVRDRHRELVRNNPWVFKACSVIGAGVVGYGITGEIKHPKSATETRLNDRWQRWAGTLACDADGLHDVFGLQGLAAFAVPESGEAIFRRRRRRLTDSFEIPLQLQLLEGDHLDHSRTTMIDNGRIVQGVEFDAIGARRAYHMFRDHPGDVLTLGSETVRIPASEVAHVYRVDRPGQVRGMPWGTSVMLTLRDLDDFDDAYLLRQKLANCFVGTVYDEAPSFGSTSTLADAPMPEMLEPGTFIRAPNGKKIQFNEPPDAEGYAAYPAEVLYRVAAGYGISYEALTGNLSKVNFTSGRMGWLQMHGNLDRWRWHTHIPRGYDVIGRWFLEGCELIGEDTREATFVWTPPRREMLNPAQEVPAMMRAARAGLQSLPELHRELGMKSSAVLKEIAKSNQLIDELGLVLDSDPRKTSTAGLTQARPAGTTLPGTDVGTGDPTDEDTE